MILMPEPSVILAPVAQLQENCPVELSRLLDLSGGQEEYVQEFIDLFLNETDEVLGTLDKAIKAGDIKGVRNAAHKYFGGSAACGMNGLLPPLRKLIDGAKAGHLNGASLLYAQITRELVRIREFLSDYVASVNGARLKS